jgi:cytolysin (calcineurin-like family phosphatase)
MNNWSGCECGGTKLSYTDDSINGFNSRMNARGHTDATLLAAVRADEALDDRRKADAISGVPAPLVK